MGLSWGYAPKVEKYIPLGDFPADHYLIIAQQAIENLGWKLSHLSAAGLIAYTNISFQSYSEEISIRISSNFAVFKSECVGIQLLLNDYGKNEQNLDQFFHEFEYIQYQLKEVWEEKLAAFHAHIATQDEQYFEEGPLAAKGRIKNLIYLFLPGKDYLVTPILIYLNLAFYAAFFLYKIRLYQSLGKVYLDVDEYEKLVHQAYLPFGVITRETVLNGELWRLLSHQLIHFGFLHLFFNLYALVYIGLMLEKKLGGLKMLTIYLLSGICGGLVSVIAYSSGYIGGASGAVMGLFGAFLALLCSNAFEKNANRALLMSTLLVVAVMLINGLAGRNVANSAHFGGLISGFLLGYLLYNPVLLKQKVNIYLRSAIAVIFVVAMAAVVLLFSPRYQVKEYFELRVAYMQNEADFSQIYSLNNEMSNDEKLQMVKTYGVDIWKKNQDIVKKMKTMNLLKRDQEDLAFRIDIADRGYQLSQLMYQNYLSPDRPYRSKIQRQLDEMNKVRSAFREKLSEGY